jgi:3-(3-hydroxy-phenyl)propionate hydroxylase
LDFERIFPLEEFSVIVAGAGPVGSVAALILARSGIDVLLLEQRPTCETDLRASTFHPATLDMMEKLGLFDTLAAQGLKAPIYQYRSERNGTILNFDLGEIADRTAHPYRLQCEQWKLTRLATEILGEIPNARVEFSRKVVGYTETPDGIVAEIEGLDGIEKRRAKYLIACDGSNSIIRGLSGIEFEGFTYPEKFLCLSTFWPLQDHFHDLSYVNYIADIEEWTVLLRTPSVWRILVPAAEEADDAFLLSDAKKNEIMQRLIGHGDEVVTEHRTIYRVHQRVAKSYRKGRVILAGDAAHLNNPLGGLGMNSGIHDVWNLCHKLIRIFSGDGDDALLDHYERQRRTVMVEFVQAQTIRNKQIMERGAIDSARDSELSLFEIAADPKKRREYLLTQSLYRSLEREAEIS